MNRAQADKERAECRAAMADMSTNDLLALRRAWCDAEGQRPAIVRLQAKLELRSRGVSAADISNFTEEATS